VSFGIIKEHDGWIEVDGADRGGTVFRIYLPSSQSATGSMTAMDRAS